MRLNALILTIVAFAGPVAAAQVNPIFDPDDFLDSRERTAPLFISRLILGAARSFVDDYRPLHQDIGFLHLSNSLYWSNFQVNYKHSEVRGENVNGAERVQVCPCVPPVYFPTTTSPLPGTKDALQFAFYKASWIDRRFMLRYQVSVVRQDVETVATYPDTDHVASRFHGHEQSIGVEADTYFPIKGHDVYGTWFLARTMRSGTARDTSQTELAYMNRFPGHTFGKVTVRSTFTVGGVTGHGANGLNVIRPSFEALWHDWNTRVNVRLVWSPLTMRDDKGWNTRHQMAITVDRAFVHAFSPR